MNAKDNNGMTALMHAAHSFDDNERVVRALLKAGASLEAKDNDGRTALIHAASRRACDVVGVLLEAGADPNAKDKGGKTALMEAKQDSGEKREKIINLLEQAGAKQ